MKPTARTIPLPVLRLPLGAQPPADHRGPYTIGDIPEPRHDPRNAAWDRAEAEIDFADTRDAYDIGDGRTHERAEP